MVNLKVYALYIDPDTGQQIKSALSRVSGIDLALRDLGRERALRSTAIERTADVVIFEIDGENDQDLHDLEQLMLSAERRPVVFVTYREGGLDTMRRLMRAGVRDVFEQPVNAQELVLAVTAALSEKRARLLKAQGPRGGITVFLNAKGGSGATTLAVNVAHALAERHDADTALIDLDLQFGAAALMLDLHPQATALDALRDPQRIDPVFVQALLARHASGLDVLASPASMTPPQGLEEESAVQLLQAATENHEFVVVDLARTFAPWAIGVLRIANPLMLVVQDHVATIRDAKLILDHLPALGVPLEHVELVENRAGGHKSEINEQAIVETLKIPRLHRIHNDYGIAAKAQDSGKPVLQVSGHSQFSRDLSALAEHLLTTHRGKPKPTGGILTRLFGSRQKSNAR